MIETFKKNDECLTERVYKPEPEFIFMNDVASKAIRTYLNQEKIRFQLAESQSH